MKDKSNLIEFAKINKTYVEKKVSNHVLKDLDFNVLPGEFITIKGPSGSGKTTLLNIIGLIDSSYEGLFKFENIDVSSLGMKKKLRLRLEKIGFIFQHFNLVESLNVQDTVEYPLALLKYPQDQQRAISEEYLEKLNILEKKKSFPENISMGERQRVAIARALVKNPKLILADEPTGDLDQDNTKNFMDILKDLVTEAKDTTVIIVSHDPEVIKRGEQKYELSGGKLKKLD
ncbi:MAG: ABC transporter ATP-binding protein [Candidatus Hodarchaeota archaeon]